MATRKNVREIKANPFLQSNHSKRALKVAAYCRVSTAQEEQESSFENQVDYYTQLIQNNEEWEFAGIYADHGISAVKDTIRPEFMRLIEHCKKGKIDLILTKSLSRFSRNTLDSIKYIRMLKSINVMIEFEKEGLNTGDLSSEIYLTWFSAFAQAESESISQNVTMGKRRLFKEGKFSFPYKNFLGYIKGENGEPQIHETQAETVRYIFYGYLNGKTHEQLSRELEHANILSPTGKNTWSKTTIRNMLRNEKYAGDVLLQKTYTADFLEKKIKKNQGEITQYYITDNHPAIIPREIFREVQLEIARRGGKRKVSCKKTKTDQGKYTSKYALSERLVCSECGSMYRRSLWIKRDGTRENVWRCINRLEFGKKYCKNSPSMKEPALHEAILKCVKSVFQNRDEVIKAIEDAQSKICLFEDNSVDIINIEERLNAIDAELENLLRLASQSSVETYFDNKFKELTYEKMQLSTQLENLRKTNTQKHPHNNRLEKLWGISKSEIFDEEIIDDAFIRRVVEQVTVVAKNEIEVRFVGGFVKKLYME